METTLQIKVENKRRKGAKQEPSGFLPQKWFLPLFVFLFKKRKENSHPSHLSLFAYLSRGSKPNSLPPLLVPLSANLLSSKQKK